MEKQSYFDTLRDALESEGLSDLWPTNLNVNYGESICLVVDYLVISIYRNNITGRYERPIHYKTI